MFSSATCRNDHRNELPFEEVSGNRSSEIGGDGAQIGRVCRKVSGVRNEATQLGSTGEENALIQALRRGGAQSLNQTGQQIVQRNLNIQPTLSIRPGFPVRVIVTRDLVLAPYGSGAEIEMTRLD